MMRIAITGSRGVVGTVLTKGLAHMDITQMDLPDRDICDYPTLVDAFRGQEAVVHLAWVAESAPGSKALHHDNFTMIQQVYRAALEAGVPRVVMASSVHAADVRGLHPSTVGRLSETGVPNGAYGAAKQFVESLGMYYAGKGLEVTCLRFGAVNSTDTEPTQNDFERAVWLRHKDLVSIVRAVLVRPLVTGSFHVGIAISADHFLATADAPSLFDPFDPYEPHSKPADLAIIN
jgi:nucleoside-diphosphate-sugar epimerase